MDRHEERNRSWRRLRSAGRIGLAILGGGLFALLAWDPRPAPRETREQADPETAHPNRTAKPPGDAAFESNAAAFDTPLATVRHSTMRPAAAINPTTRAETPDAVSSLAEVTNDVGKRMQFTPVVEHGTRTNRSQNPRAPP